MLHYFVVFTCLCAMSMTMPIPNYYSYSPAAGEGSGTEFSTARDGRITGVRVYEYPYTGYYSNINGLQLQYDGNWTALVGVNGYGNLKEMTLFDNEYFVQLSGKYYSGYISELMFVSNKGRSFKVGQGNGLSFNFYPAYNGSELRFLSGRQNGFALTSIGAHWALFNSSSTAS